jgi:hypothetical protein
MLFSQLLFDQTKQMPISRHHVHLGLLPVSRVVVDVARTTPLSLIALR